MPQKILLVASLALIISTLGWSTPAEAVPCGACEACKGSRWIGYWCANPPPDSWGSCACSSDPVNGEWCSPGGSECYYIEIIY
jgi:hypothetical protein